MNEVIYKRELSHSYMAVKSEDRDIEEKYAYRMMAKNRVGKLIACSIRQMDGDIWLYYDISSRQPLERLYESRKLGTEELSQILHGIAAMQEDLGEYLLDEQGLMLDSGTLFADVETEELYFCYDPDQNICDKRYAKLSDFFLEHVDHGEEHAVNIAYQFYKLSKSEYFVLSSFLPFVEKEMAAARTKQTQPETLYWEENDEREEREILTEEEEEPEKPAKKKGLFARLFGKRKSAAAEEGQNCQEWPDMVWDSYVGQVDFAKSGETIYFTDLEKPPKTAGGVPCLLEESGEIKYVLDNLPVTVGKMKGRAGIVLTDSSVSRMHARLSAAENGISVTDLNSRNGTVINGKKLSPNETAQLQEGDLIQFGRERFRYGLVDSKALK